MTGGYPKLPRGFPTRNNFAKGLGLPMLKELIGGEADVLDDLAEKIRRDVATRMKRNRRDATIGVTKLLVGAALTNL